MKKYAVISMDVEDWYHNDYFLDSTDADRSFHMLDGLGTMADILREKQIKGTFFVLSELLPLIKDQVAALDKEGHEIACHGSTHTRPITLQPEQFRSQLAEGKRSIEAVVGHEIIGYRAPTYGLDDARMQVVRELGFRFDSSKNEFAQNPKYGRLELAGFEQAAGNIYVNGDFCEFAISTQEIAGYRLPLGGGYLRMLPWLFNKLQLRRYAKSGRYYVLYVHPFELSVKRVPRVQDAGFKNRIRSTLGRRHMEKRVKQVIRLLQDEGYQFVTFGQLRQITLQERNAAAAQ